MSYTLEQKNAARAVMAAVDSLPNPNGITLKALAAEARAIAGLLDDCVTMGLETHTQVEEAAKS